MIYCGLVFSDHCDFVLLITKNVFQNFAKISRKLLLIVRNLNCLCNFLKLAALMDVCECVLIYQNILMERLYTCGAKLLLLFAWFDEQSVLFLKLSVHSTD